MVHATWTLAKSKSGLFEDQSLRARKAIKGKTDGPLAVRSAPPAAGRALSARPACRRSQTNSPEPTQSWPSRAPGGAKK